MSNMHQFQESDEPLHTPTNVLALAPLRDDTPKSTTLREEHRQVNQ